MIAGPGVLQDSPVGRHQCRVEFASGGDHEPIDRIGSGISVRGINPASIAMGQFTSVR